MNKQEAYDALDQVHVLNEERRYREALIIADSLEERFVKAAPDMNTLIETYLCNKEYGKAKEWLVKLRERSSGKRVLFQLVLVCLRMDELEEARYYFDKYLEVAPADSDRYELEYRIRRKEGAEYSELIGILKNLNQENYSEKWGYELAKLYHKAGMEKECVAECDNLVLWFGEGELVEKAKMLRAFHRGEDVMAQLQKEIQKEKEEQDQEDFKEAEPEIATEEEKEVLPAEPEGAQKEEQIPFAEESQETISQEETVPQEEQEEETPEPQEPTAKEEEFRETEEVPQEVTEETPKKVVVVEPVPDQQEPEPMEFAGISLATYFGPELCNSAIKSQIEYVCNEIANGVHPHFMITGASQEICLDFAKEMAKFLKAVDVIPTTRTAKIQGEKLNQLDLEKQAKVLEDTILLIMGGEILTEESQNGIMKLRRALGNQITVMIVETGEVSKQWLVNFGCPIDLGA